MMSGYTLNEGDGKKKRDTTDVSCQAALSEQPVFLPQEPTSSTQVATLDIPNAAQLKRDIC